MKTWSGKNDIPTESYEYLWRSAMCVCVMCLCNICIDVKRLTQGAQVWLSFLCQRRPPDVIAISRGDVPLTYLQFFLHLFSDRRGTGPSHDDRSPHHFHGLLAAWFPQITSVIIFYSFLVIETHVDMLIDVSSGHLGGCEIKHDKPPFASYNPHLLWPAIVFIHHIFLAGENAWSNSLGKKTSHWFPL